MSDTRWGCLRAAGLRVAVGAGALVLAACAGAPSGGTAGAPAVDQGLYLDVIRQLHANGRSHAALAYLDDYDNRWQPSGETALLRARILLSLGEAEAARSLFVSLADGPLRDEAMAGLGSIALRQGRMDEALAAFRISVDLSPAEPRFLNNLGYALMLDERPEAALGVLARAADLAPENVRIRNNLAIAAHWSGERRLSETIVAGVPGTRERSDLRSLVDSFYE